MHESREARHTKSKIQLDWTLSEFNNFVCQSYPHFSLNLVCFYLASTGKGRKIKQLHVLKAAVGKSRIYSVAVMYCLKNHAVFSNTGFHFSGCCTNHTIPSRIYTAPKQPGYLVYHFNANPGPQDRPLLPSAGVAG